MQDDFSLILTKLNQPFIRHDLVDRPRLQDRIIEGVKNPFTLVVAPAGFGKTTLFIASTSALLMPIAWLSLGKDDNHVSRFLTYLLYAGKQINPQIGLASLQIMAGIHQPKPESVMINLINDINSYGKEMILVLDDYHNIVDPEVHQVITFFLDHLPSNLHLVILTRSDPPLPLARLRARSQMVELRGNDLRFTEQEASKFFYEVMGFFLDHDQIGLLTKRTEGWIAGLQMAALSLRDRPDTTGLIEKFSGTNRYIFDYLLEEVLSLQTTEMQNFLKYTSILDRLSASLCDSVMGFSPNINSQDSDENLQKSVDEKYKSTSILNYLEHENLFVIPLDEERIWYRYHHLFSDLLKSRLGQGHLDLVHQLHMRAEEWFEHHGMITEAFNHLLAAQEYDRAAQLVERFGPARLAQSDPSIIQLADLLPSHALSNKPKIRLYQLWLAIIHGQIKEAHKILTEITQPNNDFFQHPELQWIQTIASTAQAFLSPFSTLDGDNFLPDVSMLEAIPNDEIILRNAADFLYGMTLARRGKTEQAVEISRKCILREKAHQGKQAVPTVASFLTRLLLMMGHLKASATLCHEYLDPLEENSFCFVYTSGSMMIDLGEIMYEQNHLLEAEQYIRAGLKMNEAWQNIMTDGFGIIALARTLQATGDHVGALKTLQKLDETVKNRKLPREFEEDFHTLKICIQLASGDLKSASQWAESIVQSDEYRHHKDLYRLTLARIYLAQARYQDVEKILDGMKPIITSGSRTARVLECQLLLAISSFKQHRLQEAYQILDSCLELAEPEGYVQIFLDIGRPALELITAYSYDNPTRNSLFVQNIKDAISHAPCTEPHSTVQDGLPEALSTREVEVLQLIGQGHTNEEIAQQLFVARGTVKAHAANIFRKLDVSNRTEAVTRARQKGILL
jgi:LuxR family transcriptional regulator, maltose regulon positive regulatory protein